MEEFNTVKSGVHLHFQENTKSEDSAGQQPSGRQRLTKSSPKPAAAFRHTPHESAAQTDDPYQTALHKC